MLLFLFRLFQCLVLDKHHLPAFFTRSQSQFQSLKQPALWELRPTQSRLTLYQPRCLQPMEILATLSQQQPPCHQLQVSLTLWYAKNFQIISRMSYSGELHVLAHLSIRKLFVGILMFLNSRFCINFCHNINDDFLDANCQHSKTTTKNSSKAKISSGNLFETVFEAS